MARSLRQAPRRLLQALRERKRAQIKLFRFDLERELPAFVKRCWPILEPATPLQWNWHLDLLCEYLTAVKLGRVRRLIVNVPPRTMKSLLCTVFYPVWRWCAEPQRRFMFVSYAEDLSTEHSVRRRNVLKSKLYRSFWGDIVTFTRDQNLKSQYENTRRGAMFSTSIGGSATGKGCDELIVDDPVSAQMAMSHQERDTVNRNFDSAFRSRLNDPATGAILVVMQRMHEEDLSGHLLKREPNAWIHLKLPAEFEQETSWGVPGSDKSFTKHPGDLLWEARFPRAVLDGFKAGLGSWGYAGQYLQEPAPLEGAIVKREWLRYYRELPAPEGIARWVQSWDCSFKDTGGSDYVVGQIWYQNGAKFYLVDQVRARMDFVRTKDAIRQMSAKHPQATAKLIEEKANGAAVIASLKSDISGIIAVTPKESKISRVNSASPFFEASNVMLPDPALAPWIGDFVEEVTHFPNAAHDDQVDACTQALRYMSQPVSGIIEYYRPGADGAKVG